MNNSFQNDQNSMTSINIMESDSQDESSESDDRNLIALNKRPKQIKRQSAPKIYNQAKFQICLNKQNKIERNQQRLNNITSKYTNNLNNYPLTSQYNNRNNSIVKEQNYLSCIQVIELSSADESSDSEDDNQITHINKLPKFKKSFTNNPIKQNKKPQLLKTNLKIKNQAKFKKIQIQIKPFSQLKVQKNQKIGISQLCNQTNNMQINRYPFSQSQQKSGNNKENITRFQKRNFTEKVFAEDPKKHNKRKAEYEINQYLDGLNIYKSEVEKDHDYFTIRKSLLFVNQQQIESSLLKRRREFFQNKKKSLTNKSKKNKILTIPSISILFNGQKQI